MQRRGKRLGGGGGALFLFWGGVIVVVVGWLGNGFGLDLMG